MIASLLFTACAGEEEDIFSESAAERLNSVSDVYSARLEAAPNGWAMQLYPQNSDEYPEGCGYLLLMRFNADHTVNVAMDNVLSDNSYTSDNSVWDIITDQGPVLSFSTYNNCVHAFADPYDLIFTDSSADYNDDESGTGMGGDWEFVIVDAPEDASYMMLKGKKRGTYNLLTPVEEGVDYESYLADVKAFHSKMFSSSTPTFNVMCFADSLYKMTSASQGMPKIYPYNGDEVIDESFNPFLITRRGGEFYLRFRDAMTKNDVTVQEFKYDEEKDMFIATEDETCYIDGDNPLRFFLETLDNDTYKFSWAKSSEMSDAYATYYTNLTDAFSSVKYTLNKLYLRTLNGKTFIRVEYKYKSGGMNRSGTNDYIFTYSSDDEGITLQYKEPGSTSAETMYNALPALQELLSAMSGKWIVSAATTKFNLSTMKLTRADNSNIWFVANRN